MRLARIAGGVYAMTFVAGTMALLTSTGRSVTNLTAAVVAEGVLTRWLLIAGVDTDRWAEMAHRQR